MPGQGRVRCWKNGFIWLVLLGILEVTRERRGVVVDVARAVGHEVLSPAVEGVAVGVGEAICDVDLELLRPRLVAEDARIGQPDRRAVWRLDLGVVERPFLKVDRPAGIEPEAVGRVVRVGRVEPADHPLADVGPIVAIGVLEQHQVGGLGDQHALWARSRSRSGSEDDRRTSICLSALPSPSVSSRIRILSFISSLGFQCG